MQSFKIRHFLKGFFISAIFLVPSIIYAIKLAIDSPTTLTRFTFVVCATTITFISVNLSISTGSMIERIKLLLLLAHIKCIIRKLLKEAYLTDNEKLIDELMSAHEIANFLDLQNPTVYEDNILILKTIKRVLLKEKDTILKNKSN